MQSGFLFFFLLLISFFTNAQNTIGLLQNNYGLAYEGYNLLYPHNQSNVYLLDNCGQIVHQWTGNPDEFPGNVAYILEDGNLLRAKRIGQPLGDPIWAGGGGEIVECKNWDNEVLWTFVMNDSMARLHHDIAALPNGNVLMIAWELKTEQEAIEAGRNPELLAQAKLWPDFILEYAPELDSIIWEWHAWDHLIQDFDNTKDNFGVVEDHPELIDINWDTHDGHPDWMHANAIDYNPVLDQIAISVPYFNEIWIIDHSTTNEEASGHTGGNAGKGGDLLYRWGNPATYRRGNSEEQQLFFQHDIQWIKPNANPGEPLFGRMALFNNRVGVTTSTANTFSTFTDSNNTIYAMTVEGKYEPLTFDETILHPEDNIKAYSNAMSSVQILPNGNSLICSSRWGYSYELSSDGDLVWEYICPLRMGLPATQGDNLLINDNIMFSIKRYSPDYTGFANEVLEPLGYIELEPNEGFCGPVPTKEVLFDADLDIYPNPFSDELYIDSKSNVRERNLELYHITGSFIRQFKNIESGERIDMRDISSGLYILLDRGTMRSYLLSKN